MSSATSCFSTFPATAWLGRLAACALALLLGVVTAAPAAADIQVMISEPSFLKPAFGPGRMVVEVQSDEAIAKVEMYVDGKLVSRRSQPPFEANFDAGQENRKHRFRVVVTTVTGQVKEDSFETPEIRVDEVVDLELQQLYVTASNSGSRVLNLDRTQFTILDDGDRQEIVTFEKGQVPLTAILLIDVSESMQGDRLDAAMAGARAFIEDMKELDEAMLILFSDQLFRATEFTGDRQELLAALDDIEARGGTAVNDHLYMALSALDQRQGRRVVVLLSDGIDVHSVLPMDQVLWRAQRSQASIYWIHLSDVPLEEAMPVASAWRDANSNQLEMDLLQQAVEQSGGRLELLGDINELAGAYRGILQELREQYVLGYYPSDLRNDGRWRAVRVRVSGASVDIRTRDGYIDF